MSLLISIGGSFAYYSRKSPLFNDFIARNGLLDVGFVGPPFTWCNGQSWFARRWVRLDRWLANTHWTSRFSSYLNSHLPRISSDHSPLVLTAYHKTLVKGKVFLFDNYWLGYLDCHRVVNSSWNFNPKSNPMHGFSYLVSHTRSNLINWRIFCLNSLDKDIKAIELESKSLEALDLNNESHIWASSRLMIPLQSL